jgi:hypothetical protein
MSGKKLDEIIQRLEVLDQRLAVIESMLLDMQLPSDIQSQLIEHEFDDIKDFFRFIFGGED